MESSVTGRLGEEFAALQLKKCGYKIVFCNYHSRMGEIDIIAHKGEVIAFVEVKTRQESYMVSPLSAITLSKRIKIIKTAAVYLQENELDLQPRFDVFEVVVDNSSQFVVKEYSHIEGAFDSYGNV